MPDKVLSVRSIVLFVSVSDPANEAKEGECLQGDYQRRNKADLITAKEGNYFGQK